MDSLHFLLSDAVHKKTQKNTLWLDGGYKTEIKVAHLIKEWSINSNFIENVLVPFFSCCVGFNNFMFSQSWFNSSICNFLCENWAEMNQFRAFCQKNIFSHFLPLSRPMMGWHVHNHKAPPNVFEPFWERRSHQQENAQFRSLSQSGKKILSGRHFQRLHQEFKVVGYFDVGGLQRRERFFSRETNMSDRVVERLH